MSQRESNNNVSVKPSKTIISTKKKPTESSTTKLPAKLSVPTKLKGSANRLIESPQSTVSVKGIFRQRTGLSLQSTNSRSVTSPNSLQIHEPLRKRSLSNIETNRKFVNNKLFSSTTKLSAPKSTRIATLSHNIPDHTKGSTTTLTSTATVKQAAATRSMAVKKIAEKKTLETQLSTKQKLFNYEKGRLLSAQTQVLGIYKTIEELHSKLQRLSGNEENAKSKPIEKLKLVAYHPEANNFYICKDSATTFAIAAEKQRRATIERFRQCIGNISEELTHHHNVGFDTCNHIVQQMCKCFSDLKKGRPFEVDLYTKKMQMALKDIELSLMQKQQDEHDRMHAFITKTEKSILCEIMTSNDRKRLLEVGGTTELAHPLCEAELEQWGDHKNNQPIPITSGKIEELEEKLRLTANEKDREIARLQAQLEASGKCGDELDQTEKMSALKKEIEILNEKLDENVANVTEYEQIITELNCANKDLNAQLKAISTTEVAEESLENAMITAARNPGTIDIKTKAIEILKQKLTKAKSQLKEQREAIIMHQRLLNIRSELISTMQAKESQANYQVKELRSEISCNNDLFERMKSELMANGNEINQLKEMLEQKEKEANRFHNENKLLRQKFREIMGFVKS